MPLFRVSTRMSWDIPGINRRKWSNTWFVDDATPSSAAATLYGAWSQHLRGAARDRVFCYQIYATDDVEGTDNYTVQDVLPGEQRGALVAGIGAGEPYDPVVCYSVTMRAAAGRPSRKFWRPGLHENDIIAGQAFQPSLTESINLAFEAFWADYQGIILDPDGQELTGAYSLRYSRRKFGRESQEDLPVPPALG